jgi:hypothetical protein
MRLTETKIRQIIKEELIGFLNEIQDVSVGKKSYLGLGTKSKNIATNPEVRTKPQSGKTPTISRPDTTVDPNSPISSYENLIRNDSSFRNLFIQAVDQKTGFVNTQTISKYLRGLVKNDSDKDKMLAALTKENIQDLIEYAQTFKVVRENKRR